MCSIQPQTVAFKVSQAVKFADGWRSCVITPHSGQDGFYQCLSVHLSACPSVCLWCGHDITVGSSEWGAGCVAGEDTITQLTIEPNSCGVSHPETQRG